MYTLKQIAQLPDGLHCDGNNLYVRKRGGSVSWIFRFRWEGKTHDMGLGPITKVPPYEARKKAAALHTQIYNGVHPLLQAMESRKAAAKKTSTATLRGLAVDAINAHVARARPKTKDYAKTMLVKLENSVFRSIGDIRVSLLTPKMVAEAIRPFWDGGSAGPISAALRICFTYAISTGIISESPFTKTDCIDVYLPVRKHKPTHFKALPWTDAPAAYAKLAAMDGVGYRVLQLAMLVVPRISDLVTMRVEDYDAAHQTLTVRSPKVGDAFVIPLPSQAVPLIRPGAVWLFEKDGRPILRQSITYLMNCTGVDSTVHGFRATFSMWCADNGKDYELRERCLQHTIGSKVTAAYQRSDLLERRRRLLQEWADYVTTRTAAGTSGGTSGRP